MGDKEHRGPGLGLYAADEFAHLLPELCIKAAEWFVKEQD